MSFCIGLRQDNPKKGETLAAVFALSRGLQVRFLVLSARTPLC